MNEKNLHDNFILCPPGKCPWLFPPPWGSPGCPGCGPGRRPHERDWEHGRPHHRPDFDHGRPHHRPDFDHGRPPHGPGWGHGRSGW